MSTVLATKASFVRDVVALTKPKITLTTLVVAGGGMAFSTAQLSIFQIVLTLLGVGLLVSGSSAFNMYWERGYDGLMARTKARPLPAGRLSPAIALYLGWVLSLVALPALYFGANNLTVLLGIFAVMGYVLVYTPLKRISSLSLFVGAVPGALPALMGYTAASGQVDKIGFSLFCLLFLWQLPHFLAISIFRGDDYANAGYPVIGKVLGLNRASRLIFVTSVFLVMSSMSLWIFDVAGAFYKFCSMTLGVWFLWICFRPAKGENHMVWARKVFIATLKYQSVLFLALVVDYIVRLLVSE